MPDTSGALGAKSCSAIRIQGEDSFSSSNKGTAGAGTSWRLSSCKGLSGVSGVTTMAVVFKLGSEAEGLG